MTELFIVFKEISLNQSDLEGSRGTRLTLESCVLSLNKILIITNTKLSWTLKTCLRVVSCLQVISPERFPTSDFSKLSKRLMQN